MTREQILKDYAVNVEHGIIESPGKFEGEMIYAPYFYDLCINGFSEDARYDDEYRQIDIFTICADDVQQFPELAGLEGCTLELYESDQGFIFTHVNDDH